MKLATIANGSRDGNLVVVSADGLRCATADGIASTLQQALEGWNDCEKALRELSQRLNEGNCDGAQAFEATKALAPLPRAWQWLDGSAFQAHGDLMTTVFGLEKLSYERPLMYQGTSDCFLSGDEDVPLPNTADGIDFEGEFGVITDYVPMGTSKADAAKHIKLIVLINDWSLRRLAPIEMKTGFGWIQAKPASSVAPMAVTPDELGEAWRDSRVQMRLHIERAGQRFGDAHAGAMAFGFDDLVVHAAYSRNLVAGTVIGSGTVSNESYRTVGSSCIAERRAIEMLDHGEARTPFMDFGERVRMIAKYDDGIEGPFGVIDQRVVCA